MNTPEQIADNPIINLCGKRTLDYIAECLAKFNRGANLVTLRTVSGSESTGVEVAHIMNKFFGIKVCPIALKELEVGDVPTSSLEIPLKCETIAKVANIDAELLQEELSIRRAILANYNQAGISEVEIERKSDEVTVSVHTSRPGVVIGRGGQKVEEMRNILEKMVGKRVHLNIQEIGEPQLNANLMDHYSSKEWFVEFVIYNLLLDSLLAQEGKLDVLQRKGTPLISVSKSNFGYICESKTDDRDILNDLASAYYRCGLLLSKSWKKFATVLSRLDDAILGVDTNILHNATITEHLLSSIILIDPRRYVHTPNWLFIIIPSTVMHEIEQAANYRDKKNRLEPAGRMGFRALQEIIELDQNADLSGVSIAIVGEADPVLDTRTELQGLRKELVAELQGLRKELLGKKGQKQQADDKPVWLSPEYEGIRRKMSSGDTIIRDQFRNFLRGLGFHKAAYFVTADKSHAALARAEGLQALYYKTPPWYEAKPRDGVIELPKVPAKPQELQLAVPIGKLIYELTVQFGSIKVRWDTGEIEIACDTSAETLDHWVHKELQFEERHLEKLLAMYYSIGRFGISDVVKAYNEVNKLIEEPELV